MDRIPSEKPRTRPATQAKSYPDLYITSMRLGWNRDGTQPMTVIFRPYNYDTKEIDPDVSHEILDKEGNIWEAAAKYSKVADAITSLATVLALLHREKYLVGLNSNDNSVLTELRSIRTTLGER